MYKRRRMSMSKRYRRMSINRQPDRRDKVVRFSVLLVALVLICGGGYFAFRSAGFELTSLFSGPASKPESTVSQLEVSSVPQESQPEALPDTSSEPPEPEAEPVSITITGVGDNLIHDGIYVQAKNRAGGSGYDFLPVYNHIKPAIEAADLSIINQESTFATPTFPASGYPKFNSPTELADTLINVGFDVISHGNNHIFDKGEKGAEATLNYWDAHKEQATALGIYRSDEDLLNVRIIEKNGIKTAFIAIAEPSPSNNIPSSSPYRVLRMGDSGKIKQCMDAARAAADAVVVYVRWGNDSTTGVTEKQRKFAQQIADWGADAIFGTQGHVLQNLEVVTRADGGKCAVMYSLGNLVSAQAETKNLIGGMISVTVTKDGAGNTAMSGVKVMPLVTHYGKSYTDITVYPFKEYTDELAAQHGVRARDGKFSRAAIQALVDKYIPAEYQEK